LNYRVDDIPPEGVLVQGERDKLWLSKLFQDQKGLEFTFISPVFYKLRLSRSDSLVLVTGSIKLKLGLTCSRCLEQFIFPINPEFNFYLSPLNSQKLPPEMKLQREDLDMEFYKGNEIDVRLIIQSQITLSIPFNPLCRQDCKGLCPHCGVNKNKDTCECPQDEIVNPVMSAIKDFFKK